jgi:hypothetical protein
MSKASKKVRFDPGEVHEPSEAEESLDRSEQLIGKEAVKDALLDIFKDVLEGFDKQADRSDGLMDYWEVYNCILGPKQFYNGNSQIFVPIVHSAVEARKTRFVNQIFPKNGRYVEAVTEDGTVPYTETALLEHYVRKAKLRTQIAPALVKNGDIEGQCTIQVTWEETRRNVAQRVKMPAELEIESPSDEDIEDIKEEEIVDGRPVVRIIPDSDLLILPATADSLEEALRDGGSVTTICRWSKAKIERMIATEEIDADAGEALLEEMKSEENTRPRRDKAKEMVDAAGIKGSGRGKYALVYRTWTMLTVKDERRLCLCYFAGADNLLGCKRNPYWSDRIDIISCAVDKVDGSFKGRSKLSFGIADLQYQANDACNEGMDSAAYALMPIIMTDPEKNPKTGSMVLSLAAVWETSPNDTQFAKFPPLWKDSLEIIAVAKTEIFQALSVNPAQITGAANPKSKRPSQAEIANEQQVDILTTADAVTVLEDEILTPMLLFMLELDHQYRDKPLRVREYGETGMRSNMMEVDLVQMDKVYSFRWFGVEQARNAQQMQMQVAGINVLRGIPPQMYPGYKIDLGPLLNQLAENLFGPRIGSLTFRDARMEVGVEPQIENQLLEQGFVVPVHAMDNHVQHIQIHQQMMQQTGDPSGNGKVHIMAHLQALEQQQQQQAMNAMGPPQAPRGQGQPSRGAKVGAMAGAPRGGQGPPGMIHQDRLQDPNRMPRPQ